METSVAASLAGVVRRLPERGRGGVCLAFGRNPSYLCAFASLRENFVCFEGLPGDKSFLPAIDCPPVWPLSSF
jgi:hypothetical protein